MKYTLTRDNISNTLNTLKKFKGVLIGHIGINGHTDGLSNNVYDPEISFDSYGGVNGIKINVNYTIYFGDDIIGVKPKNGSIVTVSYLDTVGELANNISKFSFTDKIGGKYSSNV